MFIFKLFQGVYYEPDCKNDIDSLDHEVLIVGYGTDDDGEDYWLVKNSYDVDFFFFFFIL